MSHVITLLKKGLVRAVRVGRGGGGVATTIAMGGRVLTGASGVVRCVVNGGVGGACEWGGRDHNDLMTFAWRRSGRRSVVEQYI